MESDLNITICSQSIILSRHRAAFWVEEKTLLIADLHWLREEVAQASGCAWPQKSLETDLARLTNVLHQFQPRRIIVLGDLIHHFTALKTISSGVKLIEGFRRENPVEMILILGNHDRGIKSLLPSNWRINLENKLQEGPFEFVHEVIKQNSEKFCFSGHLHPTIRLKNNRLNIRTACFALTEKSLIMPAFSSLAGGADVCISDYTQIYAVTPERVLAVKNSNLNNSVPAEEEQPKDQTKSTRNTEHPQ